MRYDMRFTYCRFHFPYDPDSYQRQFHHWTVQDAGKKNASYITLNNLLLNILYGHNDC
jgi:hypothetical protein